jgi:hypothetical protein
MGEELETKVRALIDKTPRYADDDADDANCCDNFR